MYLDPRPTGSAEGATVGCTPRLTGVQNNTNHPKG